MLQKELLNLLPLKKQSLIIMKKPVKILLWILGVLLGLVLLFMFVVGPIMKKQTKKHSPEQNITYTQNDLELTAFYSSPSKKGREIFGGLVPYGEVWRTGANEATTFTTNKELTIDGEKLAAGTYTLWTIPNEDTWQIIFNSKMYGWGVKVTDQKAAREAEHDALVTEVNVSKSYNVTENFSISFEDGDSGSVIMLIAWDNVVVGVKMDSE